MALLLVRDYLLANEPLFLTSHSTRQRQAGPAKPTPHSALRASSVARATSRVTSAASQTRPWRLPDRPRETGCSVVSPPKRSASQPHSAAQRSRSPTASRALRRRALGRCRCRRRRPPYAQWHRHGDAAAKDRQNQQAQDQVGRQARVPVPVLAPRDIRRGHVRWGAEEGGGQRHDRPHRQHPNTAWYCASQSFRLRAAAPAGAVRLPSDRCGSARARRSPSAGMCKTGGMIPDRSDAIASSRFLFAPLTTRIPSVPWPQIRMLLARCELAACVTALAMSA